MLFYIDIIIHGNSTFYMHMYMFTHHHYLTVSLLLCAALLLWVMCNAAMSREWWGMSNICCVVVSRSAVPIDRKSVGSRRFRSHVCMCVRVMMF